jgi:hypothetical protein
MAETRGFVQRLKLTPGLVLAWAYIGPSAADTTLLLVMQRSADPVDIAANASMAEALSGALASGREVIATHADDRSEITMLQVLLS